MSDKNNGRENWSGSLGFILAAAGSAIGLGNIWKFPYITGQNGGGAFVLVYLACILAIGLPVMLCEITMGRKTQLNPVGAFRELMPASSSIAQFIGVFVAAIGVILLFFGQYGWGVVAIVLGICIYIFRWSVVGGMGVLSGFIILSFYSVVAGWTLGYMVQSARGEVTTEPERQSVAIIKGALTSKLLDTPKKATKRVKAKKLDEDMEKKELETLDLSVRQSALEFAKKNLGLTKELDVKKADEFKKEIEKLIGDSKEPKDALIVLTTNAYGGMETKNTDDGEVKVYPKAMLSKISGKRFGAFIMNPAWGVGCHAVFMLLCVLVVIKGIKGGIEKASKILMPALFVLLIILIIRGVSLPGASEGVRFLLNPDFSKLTGAGVLSALGHAFFTLSLGMGAIITYGIYLGKK